MLEAINNAGWGIKLLAGVLCYLVMSLVINAFAALPRIARALEDIAKHMEEDKHEVG